MTHESSVLTIEKLNICYEIEPPVYAVKNVSLDIRRGEILGLAGESGCGKSTLAYGLQHLLNPPARILSGEVTFHDAAGEDIDVMSLTDESLRQYRWAKTSMVFQGAMNSLNPVISVRAQLEDVLTTHRPDLNKVQRTERITELLRLVGVDPVRMSDFPHQFSGGMRQRVMIAMAMALDPQLMIMDEPTTALDVVVQRDILREIMRLREELGFAVVFITHDLPMLLEISDRIAIMLEGEIVELGTAENIYASPEHAYTKKLLRSFPSLTGERGDFIRTGESIEDESGAGA